MGKALDLKAYADDTLDLTLLDGSLLHVGKPTQKLMFLAMDIERTMEDAENEEVLHKLTNFLTVALDNNRDGVHVDAEWLEANGIDLPMMLAIFNAYGEFIGELTSSPNSPSRRSPRKKATTGKTSS